MRIHVLILAVQALLSAAAVASAAPSVWEVPADKGVYQWSVAITNLWSSNYDGHYNPRAYLWIPESCTDLKGVVLANDNMLEEPLFANDGFRATLAEADCGIVLVSCGFAGMNTGITNVEQRVTVERTLRELADVSGYAELADRTKLVPFGHSAWADWPYFVACHWPERTACGVSFKGSWPHAKGQFFTRDFAARFADVPLLLVSGEYEGDFEGMRKKTRDYLKDKPIDLRIECDWGSGHFEFTPEMGLFAARYIRDGVLGRGRSAVLGGVWPQETTQRGRFSVLAFKDADGREIEQNPKYHLQVTLPDLAVRTAFAGKVPPNRPERWTGLAAGADNPRPVAAAAEQAIDWFVVQGPGVKRPDGSLDVVFNRHGFIGYRAREIVLAAVYPGDAAFKRSVQQAIVRFPHHAKEGPVPAPTGWFVREGAARVDEKGDVTFLPLPPRAKRPAAVTLCRYARQANGNLVYAYETVSHAAPVVKTDCYWHWMNGNVSTNGITADLEYLKAGGIEAAMIFDVGVGVKRGPVDYGSAAWKACLAWANREAQRLGLELSLHNSPGYSACGGPWITPEESMQQLVWGIEVKSRGQGQELAKAGYYREIARYPLATADEMIAIDRRLEKGKSVEIALDVEKEIAALNVWRGEREKPLDPFDGPRDYGCVLKVEVKREGQGVGVGEVRCPVLRARDVPGRLVLKKPVKGSRLVLTANRGANLARIEVISTTPSTGRELVIGHTSTGQMLTAAPDAGRGLECDKFSRRGVDAHFDRHLDPLFIKCGLTAFKYLIIDSWEAGKQDWTADFPSKFAASRGYEILPWLPALTGRNVTREGRISSVPLAKEAAQWQVRFLADYEAVKKELFEREFLAPFAERAHRLGLLVAGEPYGDGDFDMETFTKYLDLPMSEYWARTHYGSIERPLRVAAAAKACGKTYLGCEAFTAYPGDADIEVSLANFGDAIDLLKASGVTRFVFHSVVHQPDEDHPLTMGPFGTRFDRHHCTVEALRTLTDRIRR